MGNGVCKQNARRSRRKLCGGETDGVGFLYIKEGKRSLSNFETGQALCETREARAGMGREGSTWGPRSRS